MSTGDFYYNTTDAATWYCDIVSGSTAGSWHEYDLPDTTSIVCQGDLVFNGKSLEKEIDKLNKDIKKLKENEDMRYLYEVILVNPKNDTFYETKVIARSDTSALIQAYKESDFYDVGLRVEFDDLKTSCKILMEWKKEKSLTKAIETIKKAVE